ncbi:ATPase (plasmid) [Nitrosococcus oceani]|nr:ATPase [Nitrosococcus oceani]
MGREALVSSIVKELRKGKHVLLSGPVGVGKSAVLEAALGKLQGREATPSPERQSSRPCRALTVVHLHDHQAKGQFVEMARQLLAAGIIKPSALELARRYDELPPAEIEWAKVKRTVNRLSIRDLTGAIIPALSAHGGRVLIAVDDMTRLTPTQQAFWLALFDQAQVITCASEKKQGLRKLWWKMKEMEVSPLTPEASAEIVQTYITQQGVLIESPELYVSHVVKQGGGNPQAIYDMVNDSAKERVVDKRKIREMRHQAGIRYLDFTPVMMVASALIIGSRYLAIGLGDTELYILAGMAAALFLSLRFFLFKGAGKTN